MSKEEKREYWSKEEFQEEVLETVEAQTSDGKWVMFKILTKGEEKEIRKKTMKMVKGKDGIMQPVMDSEEYQIQLLAKALVKPKMTVQEINTTMSGQRADELFVLYGKTIGFGGNVLPQNL